MTSLTDASEYRRSRGEVTDDASSKDGSGETTSNKHIRNDADSMDSVLQPSETAVETIYKGR